MQFGVFEKFTSADLFQIAQEKSCDYLYTRKNLEMVKQKEYTRITQSGKNKAGVNFSKTSKNLQVLIYSKFHKKNHVITY